MLEGNDIDSQAQFRGGIHNDTASYLQIDGGAFWSPNVTFIEFNGHDPLTGAAVLERIVP